MNKVLTIFVCVVVMMTACKSKYEAVRTSQDPELIYGSALEYYNEAEWYKSQSLFEIVLPLYRGREEAEELYYKYAYTHYNVDQFILAAHYFNQLLIHFTIAIRKKRQDIWRLFQTIACLLIINLIRHIH